ncbi:MAG: ATP-binding protein, partial [Prevotella sp.]|nr:ATP-binding protein [Prevotella sp.]
MDILLRQEYIDKISRYIGKDYIIVLTGQRRVGKSYTLKMIRDLKAKDPANNIIYIDKEKREFDSIKTYQDLNEYIEQHYQKGKMNYILVDEIQDIKEFERTIRSYRTEPDAEIIITGSNAKILSNELSTIIGGRYKEIYIQTLNYKEFLQFHGLEDSDDSLAKYIQFGGLPALVKIGLDNDDAREYQKDIYHTVLLKDVIMRNNIRNTAFIENLVRFIADNIGKIISANSISKYMKSQGDSITATTVMDYTRYLAEAFMIHKVNRYDIHGKRLFESNDKFYFE